AGLHPIHHLEQDLPHAVVLVELARAGRAEHGAARIVHLVAEVRRAAVEIEDVALLERSARPLGTEHGRRRRIDIGAFLEVEAEDHRLDVAHAHARTNPVERTAPRAAADVARLFRGGY